MKIILCLLYAISCQVAFGTIAKGFSYKTFLVGGGKQKTVFVKSDNGLEISPVILPVGNLSRETYESKGLVLSFYGSAEEGSKAIASVKIPAKIKDALLLFIPKKAGYRIFVINRSTLSFSGGGFQFVNLTPSDLAFRFDDKEIQVPKGKRGLLMCDKKQARVPLEMFEKHMNEWVRFSSSRVLTTTNTRRIILFYLVRGAIKNQQLWERVDLDP